MSGASPPPDNSFAVEQMRMAAAERAQAVADAKDKARKEELAGLRSGAGTAARGTAARYFTEQGLDPGQYSGSIDDRINEIMGSISPDDPTPGAYFKNVGKTIYDDEEAGYRNKLGRTVNQLFAPNFESQRINDTLDDPYIEGVYGEQRSTADDIITNMLKRGVITEAGKGAASRELDKQSFGVRSRLNELGAGTLASGRAALTDVANKARSGASTIGLGQSFDPYTYSSDADKAFGEFVSHIGDNIRAKVPGDLFNTSGLASIAGAAQGAQNTKFDPTALAGIISSTQPKPTNPDDLPPEHNSVF